MIARRVIIFWQKLRQQLDEKNRQNPTLQEPRRKTRQSTANQKLRPIIIDGQNVAIEHGKEVYSGKKLTYNMPAGKSFSARGIEICVEYFKNLGHEEIVVWLPRFRQGNRCDNFVPQLWVELVICKQIKCYQIKES